MIRMKVRASVKKIGRNSQAVWRAGRGPKRKAKLYIIDKTNRRYKQRQG